MTRPFGRNPAVLMALTMLATTACVEDADRPLAARLRDDPPGELRLQEAVLVEGQAAQTNTLRWEDYTQTAVDPTDDCTIWYVGDYYREGAETYSTRIGAFRLPGCSGGS